MEPGMCGRFFNKLSPDKVQRYLINNDLRRENIYQIKAETLFDHWARLASLFLSVENKGIDFKDIFILKDDKINFYKNIYEFPDGVIGVKEGDLLQLNVSEIAGITSAKQDRHINTTGTIAVFTEKKIKYLEKRKPIYSVVFDDGVGDVKIACYDPKYSFEKMMNDAVCLGPNYISMYYKDFHCSFRDVKEKIDLALKKSRQVSGAEAKAIINYIGKVKTGVHCGQNESEVFEKIKQNNCVVQFEEAD
jgi:hypothetical protein